MHKVGWYSECPKLHAFEELKFQTSKGSGTCGPLRASERRNGGESKNCGSVLEDNDPNDDAGGSSGGLRYPTGCEGSREASGGDAKSESCAGNESRTGVIERDLEDGAGKSCDNGAGASSGGSGGLDSCILSELDSIHLTSRGGGGVSDTTRGLADDAIKFEDSAGKLGSDKDSGRWGLHKLRERLLRWC